MPPIRGSERPDEKLIEDYVRTGNLDILGELYERYMHLVYGVALKYLGKPADAKDAVMQVFEKLIQEISNHQIRTFRTWLYVLTKNHCLMAIRSEKSRRERMKVWESEQPFMESEPEMHPMDREEETMEAALKACIEQLKSEQRECIRLFYYKKKCYREISDELKLPEKKVKSHLQNGKRNLKICLEEKHVR